MKLHKRLVLVFVSLILTVSMTGCIIIPITEYYDYSADEVDSIQFYDLRNIETEACSGFHNDYEHSYILPDEDIESFLSDFSKVKFSDTIFIVLAAVDPSFYYGDWVIRINFTDGLYSFYSCGGYGETYNAEGDRVSTTHFSCDYDVLENLISDYYDFE